MADTQDSFEMFLQLDDLQGASRDRANEQLESYRSERGDYEPTPDFTNDMDEDLIELQDFSHTGNDFLFEDEEGFVDENSEDDDEPEDGEGEAEDESTEQEGEDDALTDTDGVEYEEGEAVDVDYDTVITLPDGRDLTIEDLANGYISGTDFTAREQEFQAKVVEFEDRLAGMQNVLQLSELEADRVISDYQNFNWDELAVTDPQAYVENKRFLERYQARKNELIAAQQRLKTEAEAKETEAYQAQCMECVNVLKKAIPNWDEPLYQSLMQYAVDLGANEDEVLKENRPSIFIALHKAYQFDKGRSKVMAKIKRPGAPKRTTTPGASTPTTSDEGGKRAQAAKAYASGKMSQADAFKFLED